MKNNYFSEPPYNIAKLEDPHSILLLPDESFSNGIEITPNTAQPVFQAFPADKGRSRKILKLPAAITNTIKDSLTNKEKIANFIIGLQKTHTGVICGIKGLLSCPYENIIWLRNNISNIPAIAFPSPQKLYSSAVALNYPINVINNIPVSKLIYEKEPAQIMSAGNCLIKIENLFANDFLKSNLNIYEHIQHYTISFKTTGLYITKAILGSDEQSLILSSFANNFEDYIGIGYYWSKNVFQKINELANMIPRKQANPFIVIIPLGFWEHLTTNEQIQLISALNKLNIKGIIPLVSLEVALLHQAILDAGNIYIIKIG